MRETTVIPDDGGLCYHHRDSRETCDRVDCIGPPDKSANNPETASDATAVDLRGLLSAAAEVLEEAAEDVGHWGNYADDYFQEKWGLSENIKKYKAHAELIRKHLAAGLPALAGGMCDESCDCDDEDDFDGPEDDCYLGPDGFCGAAGSEHCEWDCPNR